MTITIYDIPAEVLAIIFEEGRSMTSTTSSVPDEGDYSTLGFEVVVSHVSSHFRRAALGTATLWTSVHADADCSVDQIIQRLARSGACGLDIQIHSATQDPQFALPKLERIVELIINHSGRWRSLFIRHGLELQQRPIVMRMCSAPAPRLRQLSLTVEDVDIGDGDTSLINRSVAQPAIFYNAASRIKFLRLRGLATHFFRPPLSTVTTLHLDQTRHLPLHYATLSDILMCSPFLAHLSIYGDLLAEGIWPAPGSVDNIHLPSLRSLRLYSESGEAYSGILNAIDAPNLESLTLKSFQEHDFDSFWNAQNSGARFQKLKTLVFIGNDFLLPSNYAHIFQTFENITSFSAPDTLLSRSRLLNLLTNGALDNPGRSSYTPWPNLQLLCFAWNVWDDADLENDEEIICNLIEARKMCGHPISTVELAVSYRHDVDFELVIEDQWRLRDVEFKIRREDVPWPDDHAYFDDEDVLF